MYVTLRPTIVDLEIWKFLSDSYYNCKKEGKQMITFLDLTFSHFIPKGELQMTKKRCEKKTFVLYNDQY